MINDKNKITLSVDKIIGGKVLTLLAFTTQSLFNEDTNIS